MDPMDPIQTDADSQWFAKLTANTYTRKETHGLILAACLQFLGALPSYLFIDADLPFLPVIRLVGISLLALSFLIVITIWYGHRRLRTQRARIDAPQPSTHDTATGTR